MVLTLNCSLLGRYFSMLFVYRVILKREIKTNIQTQFSYKNPSPWLSSVDESVCDVDIVGQVFHVHRDHCKYI